LKCCLFDHCDRFDLIGAFFIADPTSFAMIKVKPNHLSIIHENCRVRTKDPAEKAVSAFLQIDDRAKRSPAACGVEFCIPSVKDEPS